MDRVNYVQTQYACSINYEFDCWKDSSLHTVRCLGLQHSKLQYLCNKLQYYSQIGTQHVRDNSLYNIKRLIDNYLSDTVGLVIPKYGSSPQQYLKALLSLHNQTIAINKPKFFSLQYEFQYFEESIMKRAHIDKEVVFVAPNADVETKIREIESFDILEEMSRKRHVVQSVKFAHRLVFVTDEGQTFEGRRWIIVENQGQTIRYRRLCCIIYDDFGHVVFYCENREIGCFILNDEKVIFDIRGSHFSRFIDQGHEGMVRNMEIAVYERIEV